MFAFVAGPPHRPEAGRQKAEPERTTWPLEVVMAHEGSMRCMRVVVQGVYE